jgi:Na+/melibiose symporter-like transporter
MLRLTRRQYLTLVPCLMVPYGAILALEYLQERQGFNIQYELFLFTVYGIMLTWFAFFGGFVSNIRRRLKTQKEEIEKAHDDIKIEMNNRKRAEIEKDNLIVELKDALDK